MSKRAIPGGATQASVGAALCAFIGLTAAVAMTAVSSATNRKKMAILSLLKKSTTCVFCNCGWNLVKWSAGIHRTLPQRPQWLCVAQYRAGGE